MNPPRGNLFIVSAPSGGGKTSLTRAVLARLSARGQQAAISVSYTTRAPRPGEEDGVHYHFVDESRFVEMIERTELLEHAHLRVEAALLGHVAEPAPGRRSTWINGKIRTLYTDLHRMGHAHSVEAWQDDRLVGGLYGVAVGRMFYGESMFSRATDASKVALVTLVKELAVRGFPLIDCQMKTPLLASLGGREIPRSAFLRSLSALVNYAEPPGKWSLVKT